jgi:maltose-binding protein MalE
MTTDHDVHCRAMRRAVWNEPVRAPAPPDTERRHKPDRRPRALLALFAVLALAACEGRKQGSLVLWHSYNGAERDALTLSVAKWNDQHPEQLVELVSVPHAGFGDKLTSAIPGGNGPDLFIYAQDRMGGWVDAGIVEPIEFWLDDARLDRFTPGSITPLGYKGSLWGLPVTLKSLALFYRTDLAKTPPASTQALIDLAPAMRERNGYAIVYSNVDLYGHAPWLYGFGGKILDDNGQLAIASEEAAQAMAFAKRLVDEKVAPEKAEGTNVAQLFNAGRAATAISGPWFLGDIDPSVPWAVTSLPTVTETGKPAAPFLGVEGLIMSARATDKDGAFAVMDFLTSDAAAIDRVTVGRQVVPNRAADTEIAADATLSAFRAQLDHTVPMAMDPAMRMVWTPYKNALGEVLAGRGEPGQQLLVVEREVQKFLDGMR